MKLNIRCLNVRIGVKIDAVYSRDLCAKYDFAEARGICESISGISHISVSKVRAIDQRV